MKETRVSAREALQDEALRLGFSRVGIAPAEALHPEYERLSDWLARGYHGSMEWMARDPARRTDPGAIVPGARSVVCVALNYYTSPRHVDAAGVGKISRYAWGDDYHDVMGEKLRLLWDWMRERFPGIDGRYYVDTGPVMEKAIAQRAGIGWIGKHSNLITQDIGSWIFLGEIITTLDIGYDEPETDHCGTCTLCIEACPTEAIVAPAVVDSNRCISYLTIEHRGPIDEELQENMGQWIYGCDVCQDVCPWNEKFSLPGNIPGFEPRAGMVAPDLKELSTMPESEFSRRFRGSAMKRAKHAGLQRNVHVALSQRSGEFSGTAKKERK